MIRHINLKSVGCLLLGLMTCFPLYAQESNKIVEQNTAAALERMKMQNFWLNHTDNAAGAILDKTVRYGTVRLGYGIENGTFKRPQTGKRINGVDFYTEGGSIYKSLKGMYVWGSFSYKRDKVHDAEYNASLIDPLRGMPYIIADTNKSNWINQSYILKMKASSPLLWNRLVLGMSASYEAATGAKQLDPRPLVHLSHFTLTPSVLMKLNDKHAVGANFNYYCRKEDGHAGNSNYRKEQFVWEMRGMGFHSSGVLGSLGGVYGLRNFRADNLGGGIQYSYDDGKNKLLLLGKCDYKVEEVTNSYDRPKKVGTVRDLVFSGKAVWEMVNDRGNGFFADLSYLNRSIDGVEYVQIYDNEYEKQEWVTKYHSIRSNYSTDEWKFGFNYLVNRGNEYKWKLGASALYRQLADVYYIPYSHQNSDNLYFQAEAKRNFDLGGYSKLLLGVEAGISSNLKAELSYNGPDADSRIIKDFLQRDFDYLSAEFWRGAFSCTYSYGNIMQQNSNIFISVRLDYRDLTSSHPIMGQRFNCSFALGFNF